MKIEKNTSYTFKLVLSSGDGDYPGCKLNIVFLGWSVTFDMPPIIKPDVCKIRDQLMSVMDEVMPIFTGIFLGKNSGGSRAPANRLGLVV